MIKVINHLEILLQCPRLKFAGNLVYQKYIVHLSLYCRGTVYAYQSLSLYLIKISEDSSQR